MVDIILKWGMGIILKEPDQIPLDSAYVKIFICTRRIRNFWTIFLYLDTGRLAGELEMHIMHFHFACA